MELFTAPTFSVRIDPDRAALLIDARSRLGRMTVPVPLTDLVAFGVRAAPDPQARQTIETGLSPQAPSYWIEVVFRRGSSWQVGPVAANDAANLALAFDRWRTAHPLDRS